MEPEWTRRQLKMTPTRMSRRVEGRKYLNSKGTEKGQGSRQSDREGQSVQNWMVHEKRDRTRRRARARSQNARRRGWCDELARANTEGPQVKLAGEC